MQTGWAEIDGKTYYFQSWGGIQRNVYLSISGKMYYGTGKWYRCPWNSQNNGMDMVISAHLMILRERRSHKKAG